MLSHSTLFAPSNVNPGDRIYADSLERSFAPRYRENATVEVTILPYTEASDYSGSLVAISNAAVLLELDAEQEHRCLCPVYGSHGYKAVALLGTVENAPEWLRECVASLEGYALLDDSHHSALECEREREAWADDGRSDFRRALAKSCDMYDDEHSHDLDIIPDDEIDRIWYAGAERYNLNGGSGWINESGDSIYFLIDDWMEAAPMADIVAIALKCREVTGV